MILDDVLHELIRHLEDGGNGILSWEQVREWPDGAIEAFQQAGWIKPAEAATSVECLGCEHNCFMPVHVLPAANDRPTRAFVACDRRDDMGRVPTSLVCLQQWRLSEGQVARWIARALGLRGRTEKDHLTGMIRIGTIQGRKRVGNIVLTTTAPASLRAAGHALTLSEIVFLGGNQPTIDRDAVMDLVDRPPAETPARCQPTAARREARKLDTQDMYESWRKAYRELKRRRRNMSDVWYSQQIAKMDIAKGRSADTIRKNMKG